MGVTAEREEEIAKELAEEIYKRAVEAVRKTIKQASDRGLPDIDRANYMVAVIKGLNRALLMALFKPCPLHVFEGDKFRNGVLEAIQDQLKEDTATLLKMRREEEGQTSEPETGGNPWGV